MAEVISGTERKMHLNQKPVKKSYTMDAITLRILSVIAVVFGLLTLKAGGLVIFNIGSLRQAEGNFVFFPTGWLVFYAACLYKA